MVRILRGKEEVTDGSILPTDMIEIKLDQAGLPVRLRILVSDVQEIMGIYGKTIEDKLTK